MFFVCHPKILHKHCFQFLLGPFYLPRETEDNAYAKLWGDNQKALWYVMVFSGVANCHRAVLVHQHGRRFTVLEHQYGRRDVK